jgi:hypothetical protein
MLFLCPTLFIHKWELKGGKNQELIIDIPKNIRQIVNSPGMMETPSNEPFEGQMLSDILEKRKAELRKQLYKNAIQFFESKKQQFLEVPAYVPFIEIFDP